MSRSTFAPGFSLPQPFRARQGIASGAPSRAPAAVQPYPWLPAHILRAMSPRARRLMRADC